MRAVYTREIRLKLIWLGLFFQGCVWGWLTGLSGNQTNLSILLVQGSYPRLILHLKSTAQPQLVLICINPAIPNLASYLEGVSTKNSRLAQINNEEKISGYVSPEIKKIISIFLIDTKGTVECPSKS